MRSLVLLGALALATMVGTQSVEAERVGRRPMDYAPPFTPGWAVARVAVAPTIGRPGSQVRIWGQPFHRGVQAYYGDQPMPIVAWNKREIIATVPWNVRGRDFIYVVDHTGRARTSYPFVVDRRYRRYYNY